MNQMDLFDFEDDTPEESPDKIKVASWNVNSVRSRLNTLVKWIKSEQPDIICLQETKVTNHKFPGDELFAMGYEIAKYGQEKYNGVAILSKYRINDIKRGMGNSDNQARVMSARILGLRVFSVYAPNAKRLDDHSYTYKLNWFDAFYNHLHTKYNPKEKILLCGDYNVIRENREVFDPSSWMCTTMLDRNSRSALEKLINWGLVDVMREENADDKLYTWWGHGDWLSNNQGIRLDYFFATKTVSPYVFDAQVDKEGRYMKKSSDHAPIICSIDLKALNQY